MLVVLVDLIGALKMETLVDGISKICALLAVTGNLGDSSFSGVTGSDIIGVGLSETWGVVSVTVFSTVADAVEKSRAVLTIPKLDDTVAESTGSLTTIEFVLGGSEKLNDAVTVVVGIEIKDLVSDSVDFEILSLGAVKLNDEIDAVSDFELNLKAVASFSEAVSWLFFDLFSALNPEKILEVTGSFGASKLNVDFGILFRLSILFLIESAKLKVDVPLNFCTDFSDFAVDALEKLNDGIFSFASFVPEITSNVDLVELLKFKGVAVNVFKLKSTGSLLETVVEVTLFANNGPVLAVLKTIGSLVKPLKSNLFEKLFGATGLGVDELSIGFQTVFVSKGLDPNVNPGVLGTTVIGVPAFICCVVGINKGF